MYKTMDVVKEEDIAITGCQINRSAIDGETVNDAGLR